jgi:hypothetical protein
MKTVSLVRLALCTSAATALLAGCGGSPVPMGIAPGVSGLSGHLSHQRTFFYTGNEQSFKVPAGVTKVTIVAVGARGGGDANYEGRDIQAFGGRAWAIIPVTPGKRLVVFVGGEGSRSNGGFNGGGSGGGVASCCDGYGGGGASDVRQGGDTLKDRVLVAAGGGGEEAYGFPEYGGLGGKGGGRVGGAGTDGYTDGSSIGGDGGSGGTQSGGGSGGSGGGGSYGGDPGSSGSLAAGGSGGQGGGTFSYVGGGGGGGGGGYYGGGGGGGGGGYGGGPGGGGGGGSSYIESSAYAGRTWGGWKIHSNDGLVVVSW